MFIFVKKTKKKDLFINLLNASNCGQRPLIEMLETIDNEEKFLSKIVNGRVSTKGDWSWAVSIKYNDKHLCGGSLLNNNYILTAAHCFPSKYTQNDYTIHLGAYNIDDFEPWLQVRYISNVLIHQSYDNVYYSNDIALIRLEVVYLN
jgi:secreted trypsin-like serine protease